MGKWIERDEYADFRSPNTGTKRSWYVSTRLVVLVAVLVGFAFFIAVIAFTLYAFYAISIWKGYNWGGNRIPPPEVHEYATMETWWPEAPVYVGMPHVVYIPFLSGKVMEHPREKFKVSPHGRVYQIELLVKPCASIIVHLPNNPNGVIYKSIKTASFLANFRAITGSVPPEAVLSYWKIDRADRTLLDVKLLSVVIDTTASVAEFEITQGATVNSDVEGWHTVLHKLEEATVGQRSDTHGGYLRINIDTWQGRGEDWVTVPVVKVESKDIPDIFTLAGKGVDGKARWRCEGFR